MRCGYSRTDVLAKSEEGTPRLADLPRSEEHHRPDCAAGSKDGIGLIYYADYRNAALQLHSEKAARSWWE
jgi:hypothetical protein